MNDELYESSFDELEKAFPDLNVYNLILIDLITNKQLNPKILKRFESVEKWVNQCFNPPSDTELELYALNELLEGHGVEAIYMETVYVDSYWNNCIGEYINMGDTYLTTIVYDTINQSYHLTSWGDFYEAAENIHKNNS